jgi:hypothetical protein
VLGILSVERAILFSIRTGPRGFILIARGKISGMVLADIQAEAALSRSLVA